MRVHLLIFASIYLVLRLYTEIYKWLIVFLLHSSLVFVDEYVFFFASFSIGFSCFAHIEKHELVAKWLKKWFECSQKFAIMWALHTSFPHFFFIFALLMLLVYVLYDVIYTFEYIDDCCIKSLFTIAGSVLLYSYAYPVVQLFQSISCVYTFLIRKFFFLSIIFVKYVNFKL